MHGQIAPWSVLVYWKLILSFENSTALKRSWTEFLYPLEQSVDFYVILREINKSENQNTPYSRRFFFTEKGKAESYKTTRKEMVKVKNSEEMKPRKVIRDLTTSKTFTRRQILVKERNKCIIFTNKSFVQKSIRNNNAV